MKPTSLVFTSFAVAAVAAPHNGFGSGHFPAEAMSVATNWFNQLASSVSGSRGSHKAPTCDMSSIQIPPLSGFPGPDPGLVSYHVALGRGTQNYTCDTTNTTAVPALAGALATLFNVTCWTAKWPHLTEMLPDMAVHLSLDQLEHMNPWGLAVSGHHFFADAKTPYFDLNTKKAHYGVAPCSKLNSTDAPSNAARGQQMEGAVSWLKLEAVDGASNGIKNIFRTNTAGGDPPATCKGMPGNFEVEYSALYWFWSTPSA